MSTSHQLWDEFLAAVDDGDPTVIDQLRARYIEACRSEAEDSPQGQSALADQLERVAAFPVDSHAGGSCDDLATESMEIRARLLTDPGTPEYVRQFAAASHRSAALLKSWNDPQGQQEFLRIASEMYRQLDSRNDRHALKVVLSEYGVVLIEEGQLDEAAACLQEALQLAQEQVGPEATPEERSDVAVAHTMLAQLEVAREDWDEAMSHYHMALQIARREAPAMTDPRVWKNLGSMCINAAWIALHQGDMTTAHALATEGTDLLEPLGDPNLAEALELAATIRTQASP